MKNGKLSALFPSVDCDVEMTPAMEGSDAPTNGYGYCLMNGYLVPYSLIDRVLEATHNRPFAYGRVLTEREMVGEGFYESLDEKERAVLGVCLLQLIQLNAICIILDSATAK